MWNSLITLSLINVFMSPVLGAVSSEPEYLYRCTYCMKMNRTRCEFSVARRIQLPAARIRQLCGAPWLGGSIGLLRVFDQAGSSCFSAMTMITRPSALRTHLCLALTWCAQ